MYFSSTQSNVNYWCYVVRFQVGKAHEATEERFKKAELEYSKKLEDMRMANVKRKKTMQMSDMEKKNYEKLLKVPEENKVNIEAVLRFFWAKVLILNVW